MYVVMVRAGMLRIARHHEFQRLLYLCRAWRRFAIGAPQLPRRDVHECLGIQGLNVEIIRELPRDVLHRIGVRGKHRCRVRRVERLCVGIAVRKCTDQRLLYRCCMSGIALRELHGVESDLRARLHHDRQVVVGSNCECHAPVAGRALRIEFGGAREGARRLVVVECPEKAHALVEVLLCLGRARRNFAVESAQVVEQRRTPRPVCKRRGNARHVVSALGHR